MRWSLNIILAFCNLIFSGLVPVCADINFLKSNIVSVGTHLILCFLPNLSFTTIYIKTGAYELWTNFPYFTKSITFTYFVVGKYFGRYSILAIYQYIWDIRNLNMILSWDWMLAICIGGNLHAFFIMDTLILKHFCFHIFVMLGLDIQF